MSVFWHKDVDPEQGGHKILIAKDTLFDMSRDSRPVKIKVYYPASFPQGKLPVIVWSHGLGGSVDGAAYLSRYLSSRHYVIVHVQHLGTDSSLWEGKPGHPWDIIRKQQINRQATLSRFGDVPFVLNQLPAWLVTRPEIERVADLSVMGMSGHSFGALTTQVMGGMMFPDEKGILRRNRENRFQAGILYSPGPIDHLGLDLPMDIYGSIDMPMLHMTGTQDSSPVEDWTYTKRLDVYKNITRAKQHLLILKDGDHMVFNGSRGQLGENPHRQKHERIIQIAALCYWDSMLKNDKNAQEWMRNGALENWLQDEGTFESHGV